MSRLDHVVAQPVRTDGQRHRRAPGGNLKLGMTNALPSQFQALSARMARRLCGVSCETRGRFRWIWDG